MRLKYQLFLTLVISSAALISLMYAFNSWSFNRGFSNYIVDNEKRRLAPTIEALGEAYSEQQSWDWIKSDPQVLNKILGPSRRDGRRSRPTRGGNSPGSDTPERRILLVDENRKLVFGRSKNANDVVWLAIPVDGAAVGYVGIREPRGLPDELDTLFAKQQLRSYGYAAIAMLILSALLAIGLASRIVKPILRINKAVGHISGGDYSQRIEANAKDEIGDLSRNINQLALTLEKNLSARQQWMAEISHELRTPVAVLQGEIEAIQDGINTLDDAAIDSLHTESTRLGRLIDDLHELTLADMGALDYRMEPVDLSDLIERRLEAGSALISKHGMTVARTGFESPATIEADPQRLAQLFDNLLQNSVRYTDEGGRINIHISKTEEFVLIDWSDSSPGVADEQLPKLFDPLYRAEESRTRTAGGSGLGLSIVKKIVDAHQGRVEAYHAAIGGLGIRVYLPV